MLIRNSFVCGLLIFIICFLCILTEDVSALLIVSHILPGFIYAIVLCGFQKNLLNWRSLLFIGLSGGLYILCAWTATGHTFFGDNIDLCFPLASAIGATVLLILYYLLIDTKILLIKGCILAICMGILSAAIIFLIDTIGSGKEGNINTVFVLFIFPIWQTLFGWIIVWLKKDYTRAINSHT